MSTPVALAHVGFLVFALVHARHVLRIDAASRRRVVAPTTRRSSAVYSYASPRDPRRSFARVSPPPRTRDARRCCAWRARRSSRPDRPCLGRARLGLHDAEHVPPRATTSTHWRTRRRKKSRRPAWLLIASILAGLFVASAPGAAGRNPGVGRRASAALARRRGSRSPLLAARTARTSSRRNISRARTRRSSRVSPRRARRPRSGWRSRTRRARRRRRTCRGGTRRSSARRTRSSRDRAAPPQSAAGARAGDDWARREALPARPCVARPRG